MGVEPDVRRRMRGKTRTVNADQPTAPPTNAAADTAPQETVGEHDDKRRRVNEPEALSPVVRNEAPVLNPVSFDMETKNDEIAADVPLPEEPAEMSGDQPQGWITEVACIAVSPRRTTSTATQRDKHEPVDTCILSGRHCSRTRPPKV